MEDDENPGALSTASAQDDEAMLMGMTPTLGDFMKQYNAMMAAQQKAAQQDTLDRQQLYAAAEQNLKDRRYGPSLSEQLFRLSRAIGKPMIRPSFGGVLSNVTGELADMAEAQRKAQEARADAEIALRQQMFTGQSAARNAAIEAQRKGLSAIAPIVAAQAKPKAVRTGFNPITGQLVNMDTNEPIEAPAPQVGTVKVYQGRKFQFIGGDQFNKNNWKEIR